MVKTTDVKKNAIPPEIVPYEPENLHLSKADYVAKRKAQKEKQAKLNALSRQIDEEEKEKKAAKKAEKKEKK